MTAGADDPVREHGRGNCRRRSCRGGFVTRPFTHTHTHTHTMYTNTTTPDTEEQHGH
jgi:hypothetical protein